jgi:hypothetical protein
MEYKCDKCNKYYKTYQTLWKHNKEFHKNNNTNVKNVKINVKNGEENVKNVDKNVKNVKLIKSLTCEICNKIFNNRPAKSIHKKKCVEKQEQEEEKKIKEQEENNKIKQLEETIIELKKQVSTILEEKGKIHHKTLQKINNQINNSNINNGQIINNTYVKFGDVDYQRILNNKQVKHILNQQFMSLEESIKLVHFNKDLPEYNNVFITNMRDDIGYIFNGKEFISIKKNEMLNELIDTHVKEINLSLEKHKNNLNEKYVTRLEKFLDMLNDDDTKFTDQNNQRTYPSYKAYKINSLKLLIYNSSDKKKLDELNSIELKEKIYDEVEDDIDTEYDYSNYNINNDNELIL